MKIFLNNESMKHKQEIIDHLESEILFNFNYSCLEYEIFPSELECNYIKAGDEMKGAMLLDMINGLIERINQ